MVATRDKNGVYVAEENYNDMVLRLEKNEADICEKIATIRAVNEELNKKEVCLIVILISNIIFNIKLFLIL